MLRPAAHCRSRRQDTPAGGHRPVAADRAPARARIDHDPLPAAACRARHDRAAMACPARAAGIRARSTPARGRARLRAGAEPDPHDQVAGGPRLRHAHATTATDAAACCRSRRPASPSSRCWPRKPRSPSTTRRSRYGAERMETADRHAQRSGRARAAARNGGRARDEPRRPAQLFPLLDLLPGAHRARHEGHRIRLRRPPSAPWREPQARISGRQSAGPGAGAGLGRRHRDRPVAGHHGVSRRGGARTAAPAGRSAWPRAGARHLPDDRLRHPPGQQSARPQRPALALRRRRCEIADWFRHWVNETFQPLEKILEEPPRPAASAMATRPAWPISALSPRWPTMPASTST
jgi:hypothetical protein